MMRITSPVSKKFFSLPERLVLIPSRNRNCCGSRGRALWPHCLRSGNHARTSQVRFTISTLPTGSPCGTTHVMNTIGTW
ncbi:centrosomal protein 164 [Rhinolophus ferrumequinum]|uniref:Centrosomal protein 164 n=1 Tax=Rhinolophus ferrumequinum TaxID=59479 RepID=A0A7J7W638_RHIFE|nr:centrosomal protein 164 [Rhinolophus ferrumequinum]